MTLETLKAEYQNTPEYHVHINDLFTQLVNQDNQLRPHRDWVQGNVFGFGEKSFWWLWKTLLAELPGNAKAIEIGVFKGATISLWQMLRPDLLVYGVSPMNGDGTGWTEDDYWAHLNRIYNTFNKGLDPVMLPIIFEGYSEDAEIIRRATREYDLCYVDGGHSYETALSDLNNYGAMVKSGGYLAIDDCMCDAAFPPSGYFTGIAEVTKAKQDYMAENGEKWDFVFSVVHLAIYRRK